MADVFIGGTSTSNPSAASTSNSMKTLCRAVGMPIRLPATEGMVRIGAKWMLRTDPELALYGRYVVSKRLREEGFAFRFAGLAEAIADLLR